MSESTHLRTHAHMDARTKKGGETSGQKNEGMIVLQPVLVKRLAWSGALFAPAEPALAHLSPEDGERATYRNVGRSGSA